MKAKLLYRYEVIYELWREIKKEEFDLLKDVEAFINKWYRYIVRITKNTKKWHWVLWMLYKKNKKIKVKF